MNPLAFDSKFLNLLVIKLLNLNLVFDSITLKSFFDILSFFLHNYYLLLFVYQALFVNH
jgi:hypothetical protein